ncbi:MAG: methyltransferase domain-containing protein, partial [Nocardioidaceae bacterium]
MSFAVSADAYARFMGAWSEPLADLFVEHLDLRPGQRALDVGCGPGALTARLVDRLGAQAVLAVDPSASFVAALGERFPGIDVREAGAERLPFPDDHVDVAAAQLVVHFMSDPVQGLREMGRVVRPGGTVAACVWDHAGSGGPLTVFWRAVLEVLPGAEDESGLPGAREGHLVELAEAAGLSRLEQSSLSVRRHFASVDDWWQPFTLGVGPAGALVARLDDEGRAALRSRCIELLPP